MAQAQLDKLASALDKLEARLSAIETKLGGSASSAPTSGAGCGASVQAFDSLVASHIPQWVANSKAIATEVGEHAVLFQEALQELRGVIIQASGMKKPANISSLIGGLAAAIGKVASFQDSHRKTQFRDHLTAIENGVAALGWVTAEKAPASFAKEQGEPAFMYTDRVLKNFKGKEEVHTQWARGFADFLKELPNYVKAHHTTGLTYAA